MGGGGQLSVLSASRVPVLPGIELLCSHGPLQHLPL